MNWTLSVIIICTILTLIFCWQEYRRPNGRRLGWRILAVLLAVAALACIALPISYNGQIPVANHSDALLLTAGFNKDSIPASKPVFAIDPSVKKSYAKATLASSIQEIANLKPALKQIRILGYGLNEDELKQFGTLAVSYSAPAAPAGIQAISWPGKLKTGETLLIQGHFKNTEAKPVKLLLKGLNTSLDSVSIAAKQTANFQLSTIPKPTGRVVYNLLALSGTDTLSADDVPVEIQSSKPIKVLLLNTSPNFETRFLKNWLGENGYAVASRATISQNKISEEYVNMGKLGLQRLSAGVLAQFDLLVGDLSALKALTPAEGSALREQVTQKGLGIIIRADSSGKSASWLQRDFPVNTLILKDQLTVPLVLQNKKSKTAKLIIDPSYIGYRNNTQILVTDAQQHELAVTALAGAGKLIFTTLNHTHTWLLAGNKTDYASLWSLLINKSARKLPQVQELKIASALPKVNKPVQMVWQSAVPPSIMRINNQMIAPLQNPTVPYEWINTFWPQKSGWQNVISGNSTNLSWYIYQNSSYNVLKSIKTIKETEHFVSKTTKNISVTKQIQQIAKIESPKTYFYLILLATCTFLWVERKFAV